jgi:hypothetical protein
MEVSHRGLPHLPVDWSEMITHDELLAKIQSFTCCSGVAEVALLAIVELHKPLKVKNMMLCECEPLAYPCPTIQAINEELNNAYL